MENLPRRRREERNLTTDKNGCTRIKKIAKIAGIAKIARIETNTCFGPPELGCCAKMQGSRNAAAEPIPHTEPQQASAAGFGTAGRCGDTS
jgi:hypothetical protein